MELVTRVPVHNKGFHVSHMVFQDRYSRYVCLEVIIKGSGCDYLQSPTLIGVGSSSRLYTDKLDKTHT